MDVNGLADVQFGDVDVDKRRQILRQAADAQRMRGCLKHARFILHAGRFAGRMHGNVDLHLLVRLHLVEIDVDVAVRHRITLHLLENGKRLFLGPL